MARSRLKMDFRTFWVTGLFVYISVLISCSLGHPQCLDSRAPFQAEAPLSFCAAHNYSEFGCCTVNDDKNLRRKFVSIENSIPRGRMAQWNQCKDYIQTFLCQTCSPYAAHIFDSEVSQADAVIEQRKFPGLCGPYCSSFYQTCRDFVPVYLDVMESGPGERARISNAQTESAFCSATSLSDIDYCFPALKTNAILNGNISIEQITKEGCICVEPVIGFLRNPIFLKHADDGTKRLFVGEQIGLVHIYYPDGTKLPTPFLDIQEKIHTTEYKGDERGMLGMTFHPRYKDNGKFYMYYSTGLSSDEYPRDDTPRDHKIRIEEMQVSATDPNKADKTTSRIILEVFQPFWNHNGGELMFGDDGYLYVFVGDGGKAGDTLRAGQNLTTMLGKVLRLDVDVAPTSTRPYTIPPDNPWADGAKALPEVYAYGVRNIWRCGKDRGDPVTGAGKGRIVCGDVGQSAREEIDLLEKGANYGWNLKEGIADYCRSCPRGMPDIVLTKPIHDYPHSVGKSVTGGHFYRGCHSPNLNGFYIYGDFMSGRLFRLLYDDQTRAWNNKELTMCGSDFCTPPLDNLYSTSIISFGEDEDGEVYMLSTDFASTASFQGSVYRIVDPSRRVSPAKCGSARPDQVVTTPSATSPPVTVELTTKQDTSAGVIPIFNERQRMANYLEYFRRRSHTNDRRRMQHHRQNQSPRATGSGRRGKHAEQKTPRRRFPAGRLSFPFSA